jgi:hypothetical protein
MYYLLNCQDEKYKSIEPGLHSNEHSAILDFSGCVTAQAYGKPITLLYVLKCPISFPSNRSFGEYISRGHCQWLAIVVISVTHNSQDDITGKAIFD